MEVPLTPLEFARRTRRLHPAREAVVDEDLRLTYAQLFDRCDRWSADPSGFDRPSIGEDDLISINYTSGTTARPKGVMITHRNAAMNSIGTLIHLPLRCDDRYLWTLPMFHANGWTFPWTVTAAGAAHVCLRRVEPARVFDLIREERITWLCAAPTVLIGLANTPEEARRDVPAGVHVVTAGAPPAA